VQKAISKMGDHRGWDKGIAPHRSIVPGYENIIIAAQGSRFDSPQQIAGEAVIEIG
jgi:hypothetical protein